MQLACKPDSVWSLFLREITGPLPSFILSLHHCHDHSTYPPASDGPPSAPVYMVFQPIRCTATHVTTGTGELLPHLFTLVSHMADGCFLLHFYTLTDIFRLRSMVLCVARTFLGAKYTAMDKPAALQRYNKLEDENKIDYICKQFGSITGVVNFCMKNLRSSL